MNKALVIGGFGNIGLGITKLLCQEGYEVTVLTVPEAGENPMPEVRWLQCERRDQEAMEKLMDGNDYEVVIDMACFLESDARQDVTLFPKMEHLVVSSTGAVYGPLHGREIPIREDMERRPDWSYGIAKKAMEDYLMTEHIQHQLPVTIFRPTVTYGRQRAIVRQIGTDNSWIDRIRKGKPIVVGNPYVLRNFLYVDDAATGFVGALKHDWCKGQVYNIGGLKPYDWGTYHQTMMKVLGCEVETVEVPLPMLEACPDFEVSEMITKNFVYNGYYDTTNGSFDI